MALTRFVVVVLAGVGCAGTSAEAGVHPGLAAPIELEIGQTGFAGETGARVAISRDGAFAVSRLGGDRAAAPHRTGRIPAERLARLARALAAARLRDLPARLGNEPPVNPRRVTIREDTRAVTLFLPPGTGLRDFAPASAEEARFRQAWAAILEALGEAAPRD